MPHILGPVLNGGGFAAIRDTDGGRLDDDARWDRAVGSMQFIPSTWEQYASDGNNDGVSSPHNIYDATVASGKYLCSGGLDLSDAKDRAVAVFRYNHSDSYVRTVLIWADAYAHGTTPVPSTAVDPAELAALHPPVANRPGGSHAKPRPGGGGGGGSSSTPRPPSSPPSSSSSTTTSPSCPTTTDHDDLHDHDDPAVLAAVDHDDPGLPDLHAAVVVLVVLGGRGVVGDAHVVRARLGAVVGAGRLGRFLGGAHELTGRGRAQ